LLQIVGVGVVEESDEQSKKPKNGTAKMKRQRWSIGRALRVAGRTILQSGPGRRAKVRCPESTSGSDQPRALPHSLTPSENLAPLDNMKPLRIEHIGVCVTDPVGMARWYESALGFQIRFSAEDTDKAVAFVADSTGNVVLELGRVPGVEPLVQHTTQPLQFHIAFESEDPDADAKRLVEHGAVFVEVCTVRCDGDRVLILRDPWGHTIQLVRRARGIAS
jgi:uncharacterized glyoxalase superfamily protein PhnB